MKEDTKASEFALWANAGLHDPLEAGGASASAVSLKLSSRRNCTQPSGVAAMSALRMAIEGPASLPASDEEGRGTDRLGLEQFASGQVNLT